MISEFSRVNAVKIERENTKNRYIDELNLVNFKLKTLEKNSKNKAFFGGEGNDLKKYRIALKELTLKKESLEKKIATSENELKKTEKRLENVRRELVLTQSKMTKISKISENKAIGELETNSYIEEIAQMEQSTPRSRK